MKKILMYLLVLASILTSCQSDKESKPDVSAIDISLDIERFDNDIMSIDTSNMSAALRALNTKYPVFWQCFVEQVLGYIPQRMDHTDLQNLVKGFVSFPMVNTLYQDSQRIAKKNNEYSKAFSEAFQYAKHYFPLEKTPKLISYTSELSIGACTCDDEVLAFAWEFFLGPGYDKYPPALFPAYVQSGMTDKHLVAKTMQAWASKLVGNPAGNKMLDVMIQNGKIIYVLDKLLPDEKDHILMDYSPEQLEWCRINELNIYNHFISEDLLYSSSFREYKKYVEHSPNSPGMPAESPGRTANWLGWKIIESYMDRNAIGLAELLAIKNSQSILEGARYKPRRT